MVVCLAFNLQFGCMCDVCVAHSALEVWVNMRIGANRRVRLVHERSLQIACCARFLLCECGASVQLSCGPIWVLWTRQFKCNLLNVAQFSVGNKWTAITMRHTPRTIDNHKFSILRRTDIGFGESWIFCRIDEWAWADATAAVNDGLWSFKCVFITRIQMNTFIVHQAKHNADDKKLILTIIDLYPHIHFTFSSSIASRMTD